MDPEDIPAYNIEFVIEQNQSEDEAPEDDEELQCAIDELFTEKAIIAEDEEPVPKKARTEEISRMSDRQLLHKIWGCRHCKTRFGHEQDITIHRRIDEIFEKMKQTVK